jgi:cytochrome c5
MTHSSKDSTARWLAAVWFVLACGSGVSACGDDGDDDDHHSDEEVGLPSGAVCPQGSTLTYESFGKQFMEDYCTRCHSSELEGNARNGAPEGHDFDTIQGIWAVQDHIDGLAAAGPENTNTMMPPTDPKPSVAKREQLGEWLACEAPED